VLLTWSEPGMYARAAQKLGDAASHIRRNCKDHDPPPDARLDRQPRGQGLGHEQQAALSPPQCQPEEELHGQELLQQNHQITLQAGVRGQFAGRHGHGIVVGPHGREVEGAHDGEGDEGHVAGDVLGGDGGTADLERPRARAHDDKGGRQAETYDDYVLWGKKC
jgi:hypothetical protein